jgi:hypothetical protein
MGKTLRSVGVRNILAPFLLSIGQGEVSTNILKFPATFDLIGSRFHLVPGKTQDKIISLVKQPMTDESAAHIKELLLEK